MSADKSTEWLIDALYPEEPAETSSYELTPEDHVQRLEMEQLLGTMRDHMPVVTPSADMHDTLLQAAQAALTQEVEQEAAASIPSASRAPHTTRAPSTSGWQRSKVHSLAQIAGVAVVLVLGVIFVARLQHSALDEAGMTSQDLLASKEAAPTPSASIAKKVEPNDFPNQVPAEAKPEAVASAEAERDAESVGDLAMGTRSDEQVDKRLDDAPQEVQEAAKSRRARVAPVQRQYKSAEDGAPSKSTSIFDGSSSSRGGSYAKDRMEIGSPQQAEKSEAVPAPKMAQMAKTTPSDEEAAGGLALEEPAQPGAQKKLDTKADQELASETTSEPPQPRSTRAAAPARRPSPQAAAATSASPMNDSVTKESPQKKGLSKPGSGVPTYDSIQRSARSERHDNTLSQADGYLNSGQGSVTQRARVMELKAQALRGLGRSEEADRVLASIRKKYPSYYKKQNLRKKKKAASPKSRSASESEAF